MVVNSASQVGKVQTVLGCIEPEALGVTMTHEHLLSTFEWVSEAPREASTKRLYDTQVTSENLGRLYHGQGDNKDNSRLDDISTIIAEVGLYTQFGGSALVDATSIGIGRDPIGLARISRATGVHVIMGSSFYVGTTHPADMDDRSEESLIKEIAGDVVMGVGETGIKSGVMGEVGCSWPLLPNERKVLRATAKAQRITGAPILIHPGRDPSSPGEILETLSDAGADLSRVIISHLDRTIFDKKTLKELAETGCFLEYDFFGEEASYFPSAPHIDIMNDAHRLTMMSWLIEEDHGGQLLVGHDIARKSQLVKSGGQGYCYFLEYMVPRMRGKGFKERDIQRILVENPKRALTFADSMEIGELEQLARLQPDNRTRKFRREG